MHPLSLYLNLNREQSFSSSWEILNPYTVHCTILRVIKPKILDKVNYIEGTSGGEFWDRVGGTESYHQFRARPWSKSKFSKIRIPSFIHQYRLTLSHTSVVLTEGTTVVLPRSRCNRHVPNHHLTSHDRDQNVRQRQSSDSSIPNRRCHPRLTSSAKIR